MGLGAQAVARFEDVRFRGYAVLYEYKLGTAGPGGFKTIDMPEFMSELAKLIAVEELIMAGEYKAEFKN